MSVDEMKMLIWQLSQHQAVLETENESLRQICIENERQISSLFKHATDSIYSIDSHYQLLTFNECFGQVVKQVSGLVPKVGASIFDYILPEHHAYFRQLYQRVLAGEGVQEVIEYRMADGEIRVYDKVINPIWNASLEVTAFIAIARDITENKRAETDLRESEQRYRELFACNPHPMWIYDQESWSFVEVNDAAVACYGYSRDEFLSMTILDIRPLEEIGRLTVLRQKLRCEFETSGEWLHRKKDGSLITVETSSHTLPVKNGQYTRLVLAHDITERKRTEEALRLREAQLASLINNTTDLILSVDTNLCMTAFNEKLRQAARKLHGKEVYVGMSITEISLPMHRNLYQHTYAQVLAGESITQLNDFIRPGREKGLLEESFNPIRNAQNQVVGFTIVSRDISARKQAEEQMLTSLREKEVLLSEVYHRVKNNLNVVISLLNLQASRSSDPRLVEALTDSRNRIYAMALVHEQLYRTSDFSRINTAEYVNNLARNVREAYLINAFKVKLHITIDEQICLPLDVSIPLGLIVNELLTNCFKHAFPNGYDGLIGIELTRLETNTLRFVVWDNGIGFTPSNYPSFQSNSLGLRLVEMLVDQLKGQYQYLPLSKNEQLLTFSEDDDLKKRKIEIIFKHP